MPNLNPRSVVLQNVRLSYVYLNTPRQNRERPDAPPKYEASILIPKNPPKNKMLIDEAIQAATQVAREKYGSAFPPNPRTTLRDGDGRKPDGNPYGPECIGHWILPARSSDKPGICDLNRQPILDANKIYSGMYAHVAITFYGYTTTTNKGISCALDHVMKIADGDPLGSARPSMDQVFAGLGNPMDSAGMPAIGYNQPPATPQNQPNPNVAAPMAQPTQFVQPGQGIAQVYMQPGNPVDPRPSQVPPHGQQSAPQQAPADDPYSQYGGML